MAYVSKDKKAKIAAALKAIPGLAKVKYSLAVSHHSTIVMTIRAGSIDFITNYNETEANKPFGPDPMFTPAKGDIDVNPYHFDRHFTGEALDLITAIMAALNTDNFDKSDRQTDYFFVGHYVDLRIGKWDKPYQLLAEKEPPHYLDRVIAEQAAYYGQTVEERGRQEIVLADLDEAMFGHA